jgi:hypothetical protein
MTDTNVLIEIHQLFSRPISSSSLSPALRQKMFNGPVAFNMGKLTIEAEPGYIVPMYEVIGMPGSKGFVFMLTCSFKIF